jgi:hypothetical protein
LSLVNTFRRPTVAFVAFRLVKYFLPLLLRRFGFTVLGLDACFLFLFLNGVFRGDDPIFVSFDILIVLSSIFVFFDSLFRVSTSTFVRLLLDPRLFFLPLSLVASILLAKAS